MALSSEDAQTKFLQDLEMEMMADMYNRMTAACLKKCIPPKYRDPDLTKGEAVCIDRCVAKYMDVHNKIGQKLSEITLQDEAAMKRMQAQAQGQK